MRQAQAQVPARVPAAVTQRLLLLQATRTLRLIQSRDAAGAELQRIEEGQKCRIIIAVVDPRITSADQLTLADGRALAANIKITSTASFASPSLGDITTTTFAADKVGAAGLQYAIILNDITYLGGDNKLSFDLAYNDNTRQLKSMVAAHQPVRGFFHRGRQGLGVGRHLRQLWRRQHQWRAAISR